jgi:hypothetical protein
LATQEKTAYQIFQHLNREGYRTRKGMLWRREGSLPGAVPGRTATPAQEVDLKAELRQQSVTVLPSKSAIVSAFGELLAELDHLETFEDQREFLLSTVSRIETDGQTVTIIGTITSESALGAGLGATGSQKNCNCGVDADAQCQHQQRDRGVALVLAHHSQCVADILTENRKMLARSGAEDSCDRLPHRRSSPVRPVRRSTSLRCSRNTCSIWRPKSLRNSKGNNRSNAPYNRSDTGLLAVSSSLLEN